MRPIRFIFAALFLSVSLSGSIVSKAQDSDSEEEGPTYRSPLFASKIIDVETFDDNDREIVLSLSDSLLQFAIHLEGSPVDQAKALALAWVGSGVDKIPVIKTDFYVRLGSFPAPDPLFFAAPSNELCEKAANGVLRESNDLIQIASSGAAETYAAYCLDLLRNLDPDLIEMEVGEANIASGGEVDWGEFISSGEAGEDSLMPSSISSSSTNSGSSFASRQSLIKGLLVVDLGAGQVAGQASQMNATVQDGDKPNAATSFRFNQSVGNSMISALNEVEKYISVLHNGLPGGKVIEIAFEEQYSSKDGPSAAVACSLLIDSLITGARIDQNFAVTGDMNADGTVQPVGGISGKVRGAAKRDCTHIAIPKKNAEILSDWVVMGDVSPLADIQVFSIATFKDALALATAPDDRDESLQKAITTFTKIQEVLGRSNGMKLLKNSHVRERLRSVLALAPNHESAKHLLNYGSGNIPSTLSLRGSFNQIDRVTQPIMKIFETGEIRNTSDSLQKSVFALRRVRVKLDPRARDAADALEDLSTTLKTIDEDNLAPTSPRYRLLLGVFREDLDSLKKAYNALASDPEIQEELID